MKPELSFCLMLISMILIFHKRKIKEYIFKGLKKAGSWKNIVSIIYKDTFHNLML